MDTAGSGSPARWDLGPNPGGAPTVGNLTFSLTNTGGTTGQLTVWALGLAPTVVSVPQISNCALWVCATAPAAPGRRARAAKQPTRHSDPEQSELGRIRVIRAVRVAERNLVAGVERHPRSRPVASGVGAAAPPGASNRCARRGPSRRGPARLRACCGETDAQRPCRTLRSGHLRGDQKAGRAWS